MQIQQQLEQESHREEPVDREFESQNLGSEPQNVDISIHFISSRLICQNDRSLSNRLQFHLLCAYGASVFQKKFD